MDGFTLKKKGKEKYDRQLCIGLLNGTHDDTITSGLSGLDTKFDGLVYADTGPASERVMVRLGGFGQQDGEAGFNQADVNELVKAVKGQRNVNKPLTAKSRVYLSGHGDWASQRLGSWSAFAVARLLGHCKLPSGLLVSLLGCMSAGTSSNLEKAVAEANGFFHSFGATLSLDSFANNLHLALAANHDIYIRLRARCACVFVHPLTGLKYTTNIDINENTFNRFNSGQITFADVEDNNKQPGSKYEWDWSGSLFKTQTIKKCY